jgi:hypothetical protein
MRLHHYNRIQQREAAGRRASTGNRSFLAKSRGDAQKAHCHVVISNRPLRPAQTPVHGAVRRSDDGPLRHIMTAPGALGTPWAPNPLSGPLQLASGYRVQRPLRPGPAAAAAAAAAAARAEQLPVPDPAAAAAAATVAAAAAAAAAAANCSPAPALPRHPSARTKCTRPYGTRVRRGPQEGNQLWSAAADPGIRSGDARSLAHSHLAHSRTPVTQPSPGPARRHRTHNTASGTAVPHSPIQKQMRSLDG